MSVFKKKSAAVDEAEHAQPEFVCHDKSADEVLTALSATEEGLSSAEAEKRAAEYGKNALKEAKKKSLIVKFLEQFKDVMIIVLIVAAIVSAVIALVQGEYSELIDAGVILLIVILNAVIGVIQENKAENAMEALKKERHGSLEKHEQGVLQGAARRRVETSRKRGDRSR